MIDDDHYINIIDFGEAVVIEGFENDEEKRTYISTENRSSSDTSNMSD